MAYFRFQVFGISSLTTFMKCRMPTPLLLFVLLLDYNVLNNNVNNKCYVVISNNNNKRNVNSNSSNTLLGLRYLSIQILSVERPLVYGA